MMKPLFTAITSNHVLTRDSCLREKINLEIPFLLALMNSLVEREMSVLPAMLYYVHNNQSLE